MGLDFSHLSKPITDKESSDDSNNTLICGVSSMQGWRNTHEDTSNCILNFDTNTSYFAVYDGHGGQEVALYCSENLPQFLKQTEAYKNGDLKKALEDAFLEFDATITTPEVVEKLKELAQIKRSKGTEVEDGVKDDDDFGPNLCHKPGLESGCTAIVALLHENKLYVANAGDSRCIVCRNSKAVKMSFDHKPRNEEERKRVIKAGGTVDSYDGRINGGLNLSRAIGDHACKQNKDLSNREQMIIALPDIQVLTINPNEDEFMFLACDGIWNCFSNQEVVDFIRPAIQEGKKKLSQICEDLFDQCLKSYTGDDNMTAIIVQFKPQILKRSAEESSSNKKLKTEDVM